MAATAISTAAAVHAAPAFSISSSPAAVHLSAGQSSTIKLTDTGSKPVTIRVSLTSVNAKSGSVGPVSGWGVQLGGPASFTLNPGQSHLTTVTVAANAKSADDAIVFASVPGASGNAHVSGAVGSQLVIGGASEYIAPGTAAHASAHGNSAVGAALVGGIVAAMGAGTMWLRRKIRRSPARRDRKIQAARDLLAAADHG